MPDPNFRNPRQYDDDYLKYIKGCPCCLCGENTTVEAAHLRVGSINHDKPHGALQMKSSDHWALPLCKRHHDEQHSMNEMEFWLSYAVDPFALAMHYQRRPR